MPLNTVHFALARLPLEQWAAEPGQAPFDPHDTAARNAWWHGAVGPDMGHFPGGVSLLSDLAHTRHTGDVTRALVESARTEVERAFAWGWLTHVLADAAIHPVLNECARALVRAGGGDPADRLQLAVAHSRVELGLDIHVYARTPSARLRLARAFDSSGVRFVAHAYRSAYGERFEPRWFDVSHAATTRMSNLLALLEALHAQAAPGRFPPARPLLRMGGAALAYWLDPVSAAFLRPVRPPRRLLAAVAATAASFTLSVRRHRADHLASLGNPDLEGLGGVVEAFPPLRRAHARPFEERERLSA